MNKYKYIIPYVIYSKIMRRVCKKCDMVGDVDTDFYKGRYVCINCVRAYYNNRYNQIIKPKKLVQEQQIIEQK